MKSTYGQKGVTLLEMIVAAAIVTALAVIIVDPLTSFRDGQVLNGEAAQVYSIVNKARAYTLASRSLSSHGVRINGDRVIFFKGLAFASSSPDNEEYELHHAVMITNTSIAGGGLDIVFERLTGETSDYGSFQVALRKNPAYARTVTVSQTGLVEQ